MRHDQLLYLSKYYGLLYLVVLSVCVLVYALWPQNKVKFDKAAQSIMDDPEDKPNDER
jgi:cytochrome c oxidase cbb3-type subunit IV